MSVAPYIVSGCNHKGVFLAAVLEDKGVIGCSVSVTSDSPTTVALGNGRQAHQADTL